jgi:hypothetical protein
VASSLHSTVIFVPMKAATKDTVINFSVYNLPKSCLKVQQHETVDLWFFLIIDQIWAPDSHPKIFSNLDSNSRRYLDLFV